MSKFESNPNPDFTTAFDAIVAGYGETGVNPADQGAVTPFAATAFEALACQSRPLANESASFTMLKSTPQDGGRTLTDEDDQ